MVEGEPFTHLRQVSFSGPPWGKELCYITQLRKLKLREAEELAHSQ